MIEVKRVSWSEVVDQLRATFEGDEAEIKQDVDSGVAVCWRVGGVVMITRRDGAELVVMCLAGGDLKSIGKVFFDAARKAGCKTMRFHTKRPALGRHLQEFGFKPSETIFRAAL